MAAPLSVRALCAAALLAATACAGNPRGTAETRLRVASYNIQAGGGNLAGVASAIRDLNADIIGLQEVDVHWSSRSGFADQASELARLLGMQARFAPIYSLPGADSPRPVREFGVALLSRYPIVEFRNDTITRLSTQDTSAGPTPMPGLLEAVVEVNAQRVRVFSTHLDYRADPRVRAMQAGEMRTYIRRSREPVVVFGDLNAPPESPELRPLLDAARDLWPSSSGPGLTYPASQPVKRIDYVLASPDFVLVTMSVVPTVASDHRPVVAEVILRPPRP